MSTTMPAITLASALALASALLAQPGGPARVAVAPARRTAFRPTVELVGGVEAARTAQVSADVEGIVVAVEADAGDRVEAGAVLCRLRTDRREIRRDRARAELDLAREKLRELERGSRAEEIRQAEAAARDAAAVLEEAERNLRRLEGLSGSDAVSDQEVTDARSKALSWRAIHNQRVAALDLVKAGPRQEEIRRAAAEVRIRQAELAEIEDEIAQAVIRAPFAGAVTGKLVEVGGFVNRGTAVMTLVQIDPIRGVIAAPEAVVARVRPGDRVTLSLDAMPERELEGVVESVVAAGDPRSRTFPVRVLLENRDGAILPGMALRARIATAKGHEATGVPSDALVRNPAGTVVFVVREGKAVLVPVRAGLEERGIVEVEGALAPGDLVVVRGNERLRPGQAVEVVPPAKGGR